VRREELRVRSGEGEEEFLTAKAKKAKKGGS
jgi:hypothetical protein